MATVPAHIFRAYDMRGVAGREVTEELCRYVGQAFGSELRERYAIDHPRVIVGRDARLHSPAFERATVEGLMKAGCHVLQIGETPSPVNYFAVCHENADGSIQITASHNLKEDNGLKLQLRQAAAFSGKDLQKLRERIEEERFLQGKGLTEDLDAVTPYLEKVVSLVPNFQYVNILKVAQNHEKQPPKVVADFGNGVAGPVYGHALRQAGVEIIPLFAKPDGTFPNHIADPTKHETLKTLQETVKKEQADCGIAFDGDGDRVGFVDEEGRVIAPDLPLLLLAQDHLSRHPGAPIIYTVSMSGILETEIKRMGGKPVMCIVGHSFVEETMREHGSQLGGEQSGHFFCGENFYDHDDALVAALRILSIFSQRGKPKKSKSPRSPTTQSSSAAPRTPVPDASASVRGAAGLRSGAGDSSVSSESFSSLFSHYPRVFQSPEWRPHCEDHAKGKIVRRITQHFEKKYSCLTIDGVRIDFGDGAWALVRQSNTSPKLSICMEARSPEKLREVERIVREHLRNYREIGE